MKAFATVLVLTSAGCVGALACAMPAPQAQGQLARRGVGEELQSYRAHLAAAETSLRLHEAGAAAEWLAAAPVAPRGWEWRWLSARADESVMSIDAHPEQGVFGLRVSADGVRLATASPDGTAAIFDATSGERLLRLDGHGAAVYSAAFTPDGARVLTASRDRTARLWDAATGAALGTPWEHEVTVSCTDVSPDGRLLAASAYLWREGRRGLDGLVRLVDAATLAEVRTLVGGVKPISQIRFSPDGARLAASCWDGNVYVWELAREDLAPALVLSMEDPLLYSAVDALAWSPDGARLAAASKNGQVRVFAVADARTVAGARADAGTNGGPADAVAGTAPAAAAGAELLRLAGHVGYVSGLAWSPDGALLASGGEDGTVRLWSAGDGAPLGVLHGHRGAVHGMVFAPDGSRLYTGSADGSVRAWDAAGAVRRGGSGAALGAGMRHAAAYSLSIAADGRRAATSDYDGTVRVWNLDAAELRSEFEVSPSLDAEQAPEGQSVNAVAFEPAGGAAARIATANLAGDARLHDAATGAVLAELGNHRSGASGVAWSPDGSRLAVCHYDDVVRCWDLGDLTGRGAAAPAAAAPAGAVPAAAAPRLDPAWTGARLAAGSRNSLGGLGFSPDGARLAAPHGESVRVLDAATGAVLLDLAGPGGRMRTARFAPDGRSVFGCTSRGDVACWSAAGASTGDAPGAESAAGSAAESAAGSGALLWSQRAHGSGAERLWASADGSRLASAGHEVVLWDPATGAALLRWRPHATGLYDVAFSPDGTRLVTLGHDERILVHEARPVTSR